MSRHEDRESSSERAAAMRHARRNGKTRETGLAFSLLNPRATSFAFNRSP
jgi:hypothetical protein